MDTFSQNRDHRQNISDLEKEISGLKKQLQELEEERSQIEERKTFFNKVADFSNDWELWFSSEGEIKYCSPSCMDLTGYSPKQITDSPSLSELLIFREDRTSFGKYQKDVLSLTIIRQTFEFRLLTRSRQIR